MEFTQFSDIYRGKTVLITGHTGFKGSWLSFWLSKLGANVIGYSKDIPTKPNHFEKLGLPITSIFGDILDQSSLIKVVENHKPDIVFHLAAQSLVRSSYNDPLSTFSTNILGTATLFEVLRTQSSIKAIVNVTSDKCYENFGLGKSFKEEDPLGGFDPYSASKGCAEIITSCYRHSFFKPELFGTIHHTLLASARAGNVIGGGDWAKDRLIPDLVQAWMKDDFVQIRSPNAIRPWQHVLEPVSAYLVLGSQLLLGNTSIAEAWNFGPSKLSKVSVKDLITLFQEKIPTLKVSYEQDQTHMYEAATLDLDSGKAARKLGWQGIWEVGTAITKTLRWYQGFYRDNQLLSELDLEEFCADAQTAGAPWIGTKI